MDGQLPPSTAKPKLRLAAADQIVKDLKKSRKQLVKLAKSFPDEDAFSLAHCVIGDGVNHIDTLIDELKPSLKDAMKDSRENPFQPPNRAKGWCPLYERKNIKKNGASQAGRSSEVSGSSLPSTDGSQGNC